MNGSSPAPQTSPPPGGPAFALALALTEGKDYHEVSAALINAISAMPFVYIAEIYEVYNREGDLVRHAANKEDLVIRHFSRILQRERSLFNEYGLLETIENGGTTELRSNDPETPIIRLVFPVYCKIGPMRLLVVDGESLLSDYRDYLQQLANLYNNLVQLHDSRERDLLTGLQNRQTFDNSMIKIGEHLRELKQSGQAFGAWLAVLDIDHFKRVNDTFGHLYGDEVLLRFSQLIKKWFRSSDLAFRFGGEEFIVILASPTLEGALGGLERFRHAVEGHDFGQVGQVTVSIGFVALRCDALPSTLIDQADQALYQAKQTGRNRIIQYQAQDQQAQVIEDDIELF